MASKCYDSFERMNRQDRELRPKFNGLLYGLIYFGLSSFACKLFGWIKEKMKSNAETKKILGLNRNYKRWSRMENSHK